MPTLIQNLRDLDRLVHRKVFRRKKTKAPNYRRAVRLLRVIRKLRDDRVDVRITFPALKRSFVTVVLATKDRVETTKAPTEGRALLVAAVRWYGLGLFPHDLGEALKARRS